MRISWLEPAVIRQAKNALLEHHATWAELFIDGFRLPPVPSGIRSETWAHIAEHVARAEHVTEVLHQHGFDQAVNTFSSSQHAVEHAPLIAAANHIDLARFDLLKGLLTCRIDDLVIYGNFLHLLTVWGASDLQQTLGIYERFCNELKATQSDHPMWNDRVGAAIDGLASFYVTCGDHNQAHSLFTLRHAEQAEDLVVALCASRTFLAEKATGRAIQWLEHAADRAHDIGKAPI